MIGYSMLQGAFGAAAPTKAVRDNAHGLAEALVAFSNCLWAQRIDVDAVFADAGALIKDRGRRSQVGYSSLARRAKLLAK